MMMAAVCLLKDSDGQDLTDDEIREQLEGNLCRCTGYQNIVSAVRAAAEEMRSATACRAPVAVRRIGARRGETVMAVSRLFGSSIKRREDPRLITGKGAFTDDVKLPGMTYMAILRSPYGHATHHAHRHQQGQSACPASSPSSPAKTSKARSSRSPAPG